MCCYFSKEATKALRAKMKAKGGVMTLWKVYSPGKDRLAPPYRRQPLVWAPGVVKSDREKNRVLPREMHEGVDRGIHLCATRKAAECWRDGGEVIIPVRCKLRDLVCASSDGDAVFMKIEILPRNFNRAIKNG